MNSANLPQLARGGSNRAIANARGYVVSPVAPSAPHSDSHSLDLVEYWRRVWRHKWVVVAVAILGAILGLLAMLPQTPIYQARTSVEVQSINDNFLNFRDVNPTANATSGMYPEIDMLTHVKLLQTRPLIDATIKKLEEQGKWKPGPPAPKRELWPAWLPRPKRHEAAKKASENELPADLFAGLRVKASTNTRIIDVTFDSPDPEFAAAFANTLADQFIETNLESRWKSAQHTGQWLTRQLQDQKVRLEQSETQMQEYARQTHLMFTGENDKQNVDEEKLRQVQTELSHAQADRMSKQARFELVSAARAEALGEALENESLKMDKQRLTDLRRQYAELDSTLTPEHYKVKRVRAQIAQMEADFNRERDAILERIRGDYEAAKTRERLLTSEYERQATVVDGLSGKSVKYNILKREVETNRQLYESMLQKVKEANLAAAMRASAIRIVEPADIPSFPYKPDLRRGAALGLVFGLFAGVGVALIRERLDRCIQGPEDLHHYLDVPELGIVPKQKGISASWHAGGPTNSLIKLAAGVDKADLAKRPSIINEAFRAITTSILFSETLRGKHCILVVTSPNPSEGKSTVSTNLTAAFAEIGRRVLLIDADMRRPRVHSLFQLDNDIGLAQILNGDLALDDVALFSALKQTTLMGLTILPSGSAGNQAGNLVHSMRFPQLLEVLRPHFDVIVVDTPPMLQLSDARAVASYADGVVLVIRSGQTTREAAIAASRRLVADGLPILGVVLNDWDLKTSSYGAYANYEKYVGSYADAK